MDFGVIKLGTSKSLECSVENLDQQEQQVTNADVCNPALDSKMPAITLIRLYLTDSATARFKSFKYLKALAWRSTAAQQQGR